MVNTRLMSYSTENGRILITKGLFQKKKQNGDVESKNMEFPGVTKK